MYCSIAKGSTLASAADAVAAAVSFSTSLASSTRIRPGGFTFCLVRSNGRRSFLTLSCIHEAICPVPEQMQRERVQQSFCLKPAESSWPASCPGSKKTECCSRHQCASKDRRPVFGVGGCNKTWQKRDHQADCLSGATSNRI